MKDYNLTVRHFEKSVSLDYHIRKCLKKISALNKVIEQCHIEISMNHKNSHSCKIYTVRVDIDIPGKKLIHAKKENTSVFSGIYEAFASVERQICTLEHKYDRAGQDDCYKVANITC